MKLKYIKHKKAGFSLVELLISSALIALVLLAMSSIYLFAVNQFQTIVRKSKLEQDIMMITYYLKSMLSQSDTLNVVHHIDTRYTATSVNDATLDSSTVIQEYICNGCNSCGENRCVTGNDEPDALAIFARQTGYNDDIFNGGVSDDGIKYSASAIFFEPPTLEKPGRLHIVYDGDSTGSQDSSGKEVYTINERTPTENDLRRYEKSMVFDNIVTFNFESSKVGGSLRATGISVSFTMRNYRNYPPKDKYTYCSHDFEPGCQTNDVYWDIEGRVSVNMKNNHVGDLTDDRGRLYFYKMIKPPSV